MNSIRRHDRLASRTVRFGFTVSGQSCFPLDMLRYEGAYPASSTDAAEITESVARNDPQRRRVINLMTTRDKDWLPTQARWKSFGWRVE